MTVRSIGCAGRVSTRRHALPRFWAMNNRAAGRISPTARYYANRAAIGRNTHPHSAALVKTGVTPHPQGMKLKGVAREVAIYEISLDDITAAGGSSQSSRRVCRARR